MIDALPEGLRQVLLLCAIDDLNFREAVSQKARCAPSHARPAKIAQF
jgi:DNA-directed RNA polymerase specialized sigma24 family protein